MKITGKCQVLCNAFQAHWQLPWGRSQVVVPSLYSAGQRCGQRIHVLHDSSCDNVDFLREYGRMAETRA